MKVPMTLEGSERLREELNHLKSVLRPQIIQAIATAREHGDLRENAEYHAAKEQQGFAEGRIKEIENKLADAQIIDVTKITHTGKVIFGSTVTWSSRVRRKAPKIVGEDEADLEAKQGLGDVADCTLVGKSEGDTVVKAPNGSIEYEIDKVNTSTRTRHVQCGASGFGRYKQDLP
jgi:transcription elongation factor GreA